MNTMERLNALRDARIQAAPLFEAAARRPPAPKRPSRMWAAAAAILLLSTPGLWILFDAAPETIQPAAQNESVEELIQKLGDPDFKVRDGAERKLLELGDSVLPELRSALSDARRRDGLSRVIHRLERNKRAEAQKLGGSDPVTRALSWLARHQNPDGSWSARKYMDHCRGKVCAPTAGNDQNDVGLTGLALLAFTGAGYTHFSRDTHDEHCFGTAVKNAADYLIRRQSKEGRFGDDLVPKFMYDHLIAATAITELYALTSAEAYRGPAQRALEYTLGAQNRGKGWRYSFKSGDSDSSVTAWAVQHLKAAQMAEFPVPQESIRGARAWFEEATDRETGRTGYTDSRAGKVVIPGVNEEYDDHPTLTAAAVLSKLFLGADRGEKIRRQASLILADPPAWDARNVKIDFYYWYYGTYALFMFDGPTGEHWKKWNEKLKTALLQHQNREGCRDGSWEPLDRWSSEGGRVCVTALGALILEAYYRFR
jgi:hypothetical protein